MKKEISVLLMLLLPMVLLSTALSTGFGSEVHDVAVTYVTAWPTVVLPSNVVSVNVTVENQGTSYETFNLTVYANNITIQTVTVTDLAPLQSINLTFKWQPYPFRFIIFPPPWPWPIYKPKVENLTIWAETSVVAGEVDTSDNVYVDGTVRVIWWVIDLDGDGTISIREIAEVAKAFGSYPDHPRWNPSVDFNQDGKIDIRDLALPAKCFGACYA